MDVSHNEYFSSYEDLEVSRIALSLDRDKYEFHKYKHKPTSPG